MISAWVLAVLYLVSAFMVIENRKIEPEFTAARVFLAGSLTLWGGFYVWSALHPVGPSNFEVRVLLTRWLQVPLVTSIGLFSWSRWFMDRQQRRHRRRK